jgi:hypothetical protein
MVGYRIVGWSVGYFEIHAVAPDAYDTQNVPATAAAVGPWRIRHDPSALVADRGHVEVVSGGTVNRRRRRRRLIGRAFCHSWRGRTGPGTACPEQHSAGLLECPPAPKRPHDTNRRSRNRTAAACVLTTPSRCRKKPVTGPERTGGGSQGAVAGTRLSLRRAAPSCCGPRRGGSERRGRSDVSTVAGGRAGPMIRSASLSVAAGRFGDDEDEFGDVAAPLGGGDQDSEGSDVLPAEHGAGGPQPCGAQPRGGVRRRVRPPAAG